MKPLLFLLLIFGSDAYAQTVVAANAIRARSIIGPQDVAVIADTTLGGITDSAIIIGLEARVNLYAGRVIRASEVGPPAILERNQLVVMVYKTGLLDITTEGRVLERAGIGERVRVMNLSSRKTVTGSVLSDGTIEVGP
ncbi:MAG: flagellar basal body P-ring formation chaperone FlgA [Alphaproteobacteria bacterium]